MQQLPEYEKCLKLFLVINSNTLPNRKLKMQQLWQIILDLCLSSEHLGMTIMTSINHQCFRKAPLSQCVASTLKCKASILKKTPV